MPLIKAHDAEGLTPQEASLEHIKSSASAIIEQARSDATQLIAMALQEARSASEALREAAHQDGYEAGRVAGFEQGFLEGQAAAESQMGDQFDALQSSWTDLLQDWSKQEQTRRDLLGQQAMALAMKLGERIIHRQVELDPSIIVEQLRHALDLAQQPADLEVHVAESDRERVHLALPGLLERFDAMDYVSIQGNTDMAPGGCCLKMRGGEVDASLEVQLQRIAEALLPDRPEALPSVLEPGGEAA